MHDLACIPQDIPGKRRSVVTPDHNTSRLEHRTVDEVAIETELIDLLTFRIARACPHPAYAHHCRLRFLIHLERMLKANKRRSRGPLEGFVVHLKFLTSFKRPARDGPNRPPQRHVIERSRDRVITLISL